MIDSLISSQAWEVPNSRMVVNLKKMRESSWGMNGNQPKIYYFAGVSMRSSSSNEVGYTYFNERGEDEYNAFENLMVKIDKAADLILNLIDKCSGVNVSDVPVVKAVGWENFPPKDDDFAIKCFSSLSRMVSLKEKKQSDVELFIRRREDRGVSHYAYVEIGGEVVFKAKPAYEKKDTITNLLNAVVGAGALLEKFQGMAWNVMIDSRNPDYDVTSSYGNRGIMLVKATK